jgi:hypothetical protein
VYGRGNRHCGKTKREDTTLFKILAVKDGAYICFFFFFFMVFVAVQGLSFAFLVRKSDACWMDHWAHGIFPWSWVIFFWTFT